ncbi:Wadjet anti-phage system protein JetD domain-containing protein [Kitasatospora sp. NPDC093558]|uniref:Wadjet anti-phage system protein JetD domain-containing protein n=1 Tax=Kitasatospora sp. NPDC093558 TaxID=3155201 RepID=UPI00343D2D6A
MTKPDPKRVSTTEPKAGTVRLSAAEKRFLAALRERASAGKRSGCATHKLAIAAVRELHHEHFGRPGDDALPPRVLLGALDRLRTTGDIEFVARTDLERVELPRSVRVRRPPEPAADRPAMPPLHSRMSRVATEWDRSGRKPRQLAAYVAVNEWLMAAPAPAPLPMCERSLQIFGKDAHLAHFPEPEKALRDLSFGWLFRDHVYLREFLDILRAEPPLLNEWYRAKPHERGYTSLMRGDVLFVVENYTTCWSLTRALATVDHRLGYLAWGIGKSFASSVRSIRPDHGVGAIRYFGDLDASGLAIPARAAEQARAMGLPPVVPAAALYDALFEHGTPLPGKENPVSPARAAELASWLPERHRRRAVELLVGGRRIAQEWVNLDHLESSVEWHADVR